MGWSIPKSEIINYPPEKLGSFHLMMYEWIDNLNFTLDPKDFVENCNAYLAIARERFLKAGWDGDGKIELMWIPPFMFTLKDPDPEFTKGITIWHVKQLE